MDSVFSSLSQFAGEALLILGVLLLALTLALLVLWGRQRKLANAWRDLLDGVQGQNVERLLYDHLRERMQLHNEIERLEKRIVQLEEKVAGAKRHVGLVRYDAFEDVGGSQSFALAIYDDKGNGAVITSLVGRTDCRVYCKPLLNGRSERNLSQEEQRAIEAAASAEPKTILS